MLIELNDVNYCYVAGKPMAEPAVTDISLTLERGEFVALVGPTGSGKSTLLQIMAGLVSPTAGRVRIQGVDLSIDRKEAVRVRRFVGLVMQQPEKQLFESTVEEDIAFWPKNAGLAPDEVRKRVRAGLAMVGLDFEVYADRSPFTLSGGEMRRVAIAGILAMKPQVLLMDEPTVGLDPRGQRDLLELIKKINQDGAAVVMITHDLDVAAELAQRVLVMDRGRLIRDAGLRQVFSAGADPSSPRELGRPTAVNIARLLSKQGLPVNGDSLTINELADCILLALDKVSA
jgi:energy-coupling factor transport system ATP-binding protein